MVPLLALQTELPMSCVAQLKNYPAQFIYEPWKASRENQQAWGCVIGKDYPAPIIDHAAQLKVRCDLLYHMLVDAQGSGEGPLGMWRVSGQHGPDESCLCCWQAWKPIGCNASKAKSCCRSVLSRRPVS